ncbi:hypothetical protein FRACYDRAFT_181025 [Fragilariopsis cylindrus CCMP1102]|uniref:Helicase-associated domain-containing protein n=1 Tax=Fragilariopsis cylindrus CCMP1102 TaxID=635003 RepID=A0A1E7FTZ1_9STRA|nr:hypothetical protein FRACYDRAFT_181025 [Fragilariopsis cylindrus CCMP1102]|eukprot:OEU21618.1 hypothetical protein FRACYDRAFT_181025 [Fragilariopsis cylindrus CCMP1102]
MLRFQQLVAYKEQHQNTKVPYNYKENPKLGRWAYQQRSLYNRGELPSDRIDVLKSIGFVWVGIKGIAATHQIKWMNMFQELVAYKEQHQNTKVPFNSKENPKLGRWVSQQRCSYSRGELPSDRIDELNKIDFVWVGIKGIAAIDQIKWMNMFQELVAYKKQHQNTNVPAKCKENPKLGRWVAEQGKQYRKDKLILSRIDLLESIGFVWKVRKKSYNELWMERFQELVAYKKQHKNTYLPTHNDKEYPKLGSWVSKQRHHYKNDKLFPSRIDLLESIGFEWDTVRELTDQIKWMNMFQQLVAYKEQHQYTNVPCYFKENPKLGRWVSSQRMYYRKDKLIPERVAHLNSIHFDWDGTTTSKQR